MRILLIAENWPPQTGGIERYLSGLVEQLGGHTVDVVVPATHNPSVPPKGGTPPLRKGRKVFRRRFFVPWVRPKWLFLWWFIRRRARQERYDVVLCGKALFEGLVGRRLKKNFGIPFIVFTYAMEIETWQREAHVRRRLKSVLREADRVAYINDQTKRTLRELGVTDAQLLPLPPGLPRAALTRVPPERVEAVRDKYEIAERYILSVGRLVPRKGFDSLVSAFAGLDQTAFDDVQLVIVGDGPEYDALDVLAEREMVATSVHLITDAADDEVAALYAGATVFALTPQELPGDYEGFGIVYLEAAARGVAVIGTKTGGVPEAVLHEKTGLIVPSDDIGAIRDALARLFADTTLRERLGAAARERIEKEFLWEQRVRELEKALIQVTPARKAKRSAEK